MKIRFSQKDQENNNGMVVEYAPGRRVFPYLRWYLIILIVSTPIIFFVAHSIYEAVLIDAKGELTPDIFEFKASFEAKIQDVFVKNGQNVCSGSVLVTLRNEEIEDRYEALKKKRDRAKEILSIIVAAPPLKSWRKKVEILKSRVELEKNRLSDTEFLLANGAATQADLATRKYALLEAENALAQFEIEKNQSLNEYKVSRLKEKDDISKEYEVIENEFSLVEKKIRAMSFKAPFACRVLEIRVKPSETVFAGTPVIALSISSEPIILAYIDQEKAGYLQLGTLCRAFTQNHEEYSVRPFRLLPYQPVVSPELQQQMARKPKIFFECLLLRNPDGTLPALGTVFSIRLCNRLIVWKDSLISFLNERLGR